MKLSSKQKKCYNKNLSFFKEFHQDIFSIIQEFEIPNQLELVIVTQVKIKYPNIKISDSNQLVYQSNSYEIAKALCLNSLKNDFLLQLFSQEKSTITNLDKVIFVSNGLALHFNEYDKQYDIKSALIVEENIELFILSLYETDYEEFSQHKQLYIHIGDDLDMLTNKILLFFNGLFMFNRSLWISQHFTNDTIDKISQILMENITQAQLNSTIDYQRILDDQKSSISNDTEFQSIFKKITTQIEEQNSFVNSDIPKLLNIMVYLTQVLQNSHSNQYILLYIYMLLYKMTSSSKKFEQILEYSRNYLLESQLAGKFDKSMYQNMIQISRSSGDLENYKYYLDEFIHFLEENEDTSQQEKDYLEYQKYVLRNLTENRSDTEPLEKHIKSMFDKSADVFENHLLHTLQYQVPQLMAEILNNYIDKNSNFNILDLGCGTGLMGQELHRYANNLVGIDISSQMLKKAVEKGIYTELYANNIEQYRNSANSVRMFDLITAADVFVYIGDLHNIFDNVKQLIKKDGLFTFSIEYLENDEIDFLVSSGGKIAHSQRYIDHLINTYGFCKLTSEKCVLRKDGGKDVDGEIYILIKV
jgi:predicted TPR repeat methyltransferase